MNASPYTVLAITVLLLLNACSLAPVTPRVDAASIGKNQTKIESNAGPSGSIGFLYGAGENLDVGLEFEQAILSTAWARYSFINNPNGFSFAGNAAVFVSEAEYSSNGWYAGMLLSNQLNDGVRLSAGIRYAVLDYEYGEFANSSWFFTDTREFDNPDDASHNLQVDLSLSWRMKPHIELAVGAACQRLLKNTDPLKIDEGCLPILGMSFYRL